MSSSSLLTQLLPILETADDRIIWITYSGKKHSLRLEQFPDDGGVEHAVSILHDFEKDVESGTVDLKTIIPTVSLAEMEAALGPVSRWGR